MEVPLAPTSALNNNHVGRSMAPATGSRLQLMQARFQSKLLQEREKKMLELYQDGNNSNMTGGVGHTHSNKGSVRQFFEQRRALQASGNGNNNSLNSSMGFGGLQQSLNGSWSSGTFAPRNPPKHGSPVGWDKSYPLLPLDRDSSGGGSSSGYDSGNSFGSNNSNAPYLGSFSTKNGLDRSQPKPAQPPVGSNRRRLAVPSDTMKKPSRRAPSLDRRNNATNGQGVNGNLAAAGMRRSNSQILAPSNREKENDLRTVVVPPKTNRPQKKLEAPKVPNGPRKPRAAANLAPPAKAAPSISLLSLKDEPDGSPRATSTPKSKKPLVPAISYNSPPKPVASKQPARRAPSSAVDPNLVECDICGRHFAPDRIQKHRAICQKSNTKKRKVFDPTKMRMKGTELEEFARTSAKSSGRRPEPPAPKKGDWRQKRNAFIETIRQAKVVQRHMAAGGKASDLPPPPPMDTSDYIQCPHCGRKFSEAAAERHIPKCKTIKSNKKSTY